MNCLRPIKVYDSYVACGYCKNCRENQSSFSLNDLRKLCTYTKEQEKLESRKMSYKKWWKKYVKIQKKIAILNNKIRKLEGKI